MSETVRSAMQALAFALLLGAAACADGVTDAFGPVGFWLGCGGAVAAAGLLVWLSNRPRKKKAAPGGSTSRGGRVSRRD